MDELIGVARKIGIEVRIEPIRIPSRSFGGLCRLRGRQVPVPEELVTELARFVDARLAAPVLQAIAGPRPGDWLSTDGRVDTTGFYEVSMTAAAGTPFDQKHLCAAATALPWLAYTLRWDDPLRAALPEALRLIRANRRSPRMRSSRGSRSSQITSAARSCTASSSQAKARRRSPSASAMVAKR